MAKRNNLTVSEYELPVIFTKERDGGFVARSPVWKDCYAQGDSLDEAAYEITAVASSLIELYKEEGKKIPLKEKTVSKSILKIPVFSAS